MDNLALWSPSSQQGSSDSAKIPSLSQAGNIEHERPDVYPRFQHTGILYRSKVFPSSEHPVVERSVLTRGRADVMSWHQSMHDSVRCFGRTLDIADIARVAPVPQPKGGM